MSDMLEGVTESAKGLTLDARDRATLMLAQTYAELIDNAAPAGRYEAAVTWLDRHTGESDAGDKHIRTIIDALAEHSVASDLGPKLLAALEALRMTPRSRAQKWGGKDDRAPTANPLDQLAERRAGRASAAGMDPSPT